MSNNLPSIQKELMSPAIMARIETRLGEKAGTFITSVLDLCGEDKNLAKCDPKLVIKEALKAAALDLPINKNLGFAYVIPYKDVPQFQMGYKGFIQLAIRTGQYKHLNAGIVHEGETILDDRIKGTIKIVGEKTSDKAIGYFCYMQLLNGFEKAIFWTKEKVDNHGKEYSPSYASYLRKKKGRKPIWVTDFDSMAKKTMVLQLIPKYGPMTIEMSQAISNDYKADSTIQDEIDQNANTEVIDIPQEEPGEMSEEEKKEIVEQEQDQERKPNF